MNTTTVYLYCFVPGGELFLVAMFRDLAVAVCERGAARVCGARPRVRRVLRVRRRLRQRAHLPVHASLYSGHRYMMADHVHYPIRSSLVWRTGCCTPFRASARLKSSPFSIITVTPCRTLKSVQ